MARLRSERFPGARRVLAQDAVGSYDLRRTLLARLREQPALSLHLLVGDVEMDELDLDPQAGANQFAALSRPEPEVHGLLVAGNLVVHGAVHHGTAPAGLSLYVLGSLRARRVAVSGLEMVVRGSVDVAEVFCGSQARGGARLDGGVSSRLLISDGFPVLVGGRLAAPVLDTGRTRIGVMEGGAVQERTGDVAPSLVLDPQVLQGPDGGLSFPHLQALVAAGRSPLAPDYLSGRTDLTQVRELHWLEEQIDDALAGERHLIAVPLLRAALERGAPRLETGLRLADSLYRVHHPTGDRPGLEEALRLFDELLGPEPEPGLLTAHPEALVQRAAIRLQLGEHDDGAFELAFADCTRAAMTLPPRYRAGISAMLGHWLFNRRHYAECVPYLVQALQGGEDATHHSALARALWMLDREAEAIPHATRVLEINPTDDRMWYLRGKCHQVTGDVAQARQDLQTYLELHPDDEMAVEALVEIGLDQGHQEVAVERSHQFVAAYPDADDAPARLGRLMQVRGLYERALPFLRRAAELDPDHRPTVVDLGVALTEARGSEGLDSLGAALRLAEVEGGEQHLAWLRGECFLVLGDVDRAVDDLSGYLTRFPDTPLAQASLAAALAARSAAGEQADEPDVERTAEKHYGLGRPADQPASTY